MRSCSGGARGQLAGDAPAGGRAARVHDAARASGRPRARARGCRGGRRRSSRRAARARAPAPGDSSHSTRTALGPGGVAAGRERVLGVQLGRVVVGQRGGDPALRPEATRSARAASGSRAPPGRPRRRRRARRTARRRRRRRRPRRRAAGRRRSLRVGTVPARVPVLFRHPVVARARHRPRPSRAARAHPRDRGRASASATGSATSCARRRRPPSEQLLAVHPQELRGPRPRDLRAAAAPSTSTPRPQPGSWDAALHAAGGACALVEALLGRRAGRLLGAAPARPPRRARARDGVLPVRQRRRRRPPRARLARRRAGASCSTGTCTTATAPTRSSTSRREVLFASIHQSPFYPGTGPLSDVGVGRRARATRSTCRCPPARARTMFCGLVEHVVLPAARAFEPDLVLISAGFDAHRDDPLGELHARDRLVRRAGAARRSRSACRSAAVLEGGYDLDALAASVAADDGEPRRGRRAAAPSRAARSSSRRPRVLGRYWEL